MVLTTHNAHATCRASPAPAAHRGMRHTCCAACVQKRRASADLDLPAIGIAHHDGVLALYHDAQLTRGEGADYQCKVDGEAAIVESGERCDCGLVRQPAQNSGTLAFIGEQDG